MIPQNGVIHFWKYKTDGWIGGEWHLAADADGSGYLLSAFDKMSRAETIFETAIKITPVTQQILSIPNYDAPVKNVPELILKYQPFDSSYYDWFINDNKTNVEITFGKAILDQWRKAFTDISGPHEEKYIGLNEDYTLFIWNSI